MDTVFVRLDGRKTYITYAKSRFGAPSGFQLCQSFELWQSYA